MYASFGGVSSGGCEAVLVPVGDEEARDVGVLDAMAGKLPEADEDDGSSGVGRLLAAVRPAELDAVSEEQEAGGMLPTGFEPSGLGAGVEEGDAVVVGGEFADPLAYFVAVKGWVEPDEAKPRAVKAAVAFQGGVVGAGAVPRSWIGSAGIEIEFA